MKLRVEIGDEVEEFDFSSQSIMIGAEPTCDISLDYEGVGSHHIKVYQENNQIYFSDLNCGFETYFGDQQIAPGSTLEFSDFLPIDIGGILIYLVPDEENEKKDNAYKISFDANDSDSPPEVPTNTQVEDDSSEDVDAMMDELSKTKTAQVDLKELEKDLMGEDEAQEIAEDEEDDERKKYRPQLYSGNSGTESKKFKMDKENVNLKKDKTQTSTKITMAKEKAKQSSSRRRKKRDDGLSQKMSLSSILIILICILISGIMFLKKKTNIPVQPYNTGQKNNPRKDMIRLKPNLADKIRSYDKQYETFANTKKCGDFEKINAICEELADEFYKNNGEGIVYINNSIYIGISKQTLEKEMDNIFVERPNDKAKILEMFSKDYTDIHSIEEFKENNYKMLLSEFEFTRNKYQNELYLLNFLVNKKIDLPEDIPNVHIFIFELFQKEITVFNFLEVKRDTLLIKQKNQEEINIKLRSIWNSYLTKNIESFISGFGHTQDLEFNDDNYRKLIMAEKMDKYNSFLGTDKCLTDEQVSICNKIQAQRSRAFYEGLNISGDQAFLILNLDNIEPLYKNKYPQVELEYEEKKKLIGLIKSLRLPKEEHDLAMKNNLVISSRVQNHDTYVLLSELLNADYISEIINNERIKNLIILGVKENDKKTIITSFINFTTDAMKSIYKAETLKKEKENLVFFWRNNIPSNEKLLRRAIEVTNFSNN